MKSDGDNERHLGIDSVIAVPLDEWSIDMVTPQPVCVRQDGACLPQKLPDYQDSAITLPMDQVKDKSSGLNKCASQQASSTDVIDQDYGDDYSDQDEDRGDGGDDGSVVECHDGQVESLSYQFYSVSVLKTQVIFILSMKLFWTF